MAFVRKNLAGRYNNRWKAKTVNRVAFPAGLTDEQKFRYFQNRNERSNKLERHFKCKTK